MDAKKSYATPKLIINGTESQPKPDEKSILDYMGVPTKIKKPFMINALPIRAYVKIWNEYFRDENVDNTATLKTDDSNVEYTFGNEDWVQEAENNAYTGGNLLPVNSFHSLNPIALLFQAHNSACGLSKFLCFCRKATQRTL